MTGKILGRTGLKLSSFGASLDLHSGAPLMGSFDGPPNWCDIPVDVASAEWAQLVGLLEGQWSQALSSWARAADEGEASSAMGGEPSERRGPPLAAPAVAPEEEIHRPDFFLYVRVSPAHWNQSMSVMIDQALWRTGQPHIDLLALAPFDLERIKAGEPFRRLEELREARRVRFFGVAVDNLNDARWAVEHTPAHAIAIHASYQEPGWPKLFDAANQLDTGLIAGPAVADNNPDTARRLLMDTPITAFSWPADIS
jgi:hypothetical protein